MWSPIYQYNLCRHTQACTDTLTHIHTHIQCTSYTRTLSLTNIHILTQAQTGIHPHPHQHTPTYTHTTTHARRPQPHVGHQYTEVHRRLHPASLVVHCVDRGQPVSLPDQLYQGGQKSSLGHDRESCSGANEVCGV